MTDSFLITNAQMTAGATVVISVFTALLFVAAIWAGRRVGQQIGLTQQQLENAQAGL